MKLSTLAKEINGVLHGEDKAAFVPKISIDTRTLVFDDIFVAIKGENFDGHDFIVDAHNKGASCIVATHVPENFKGSYIKVSDTTLALGAIAKLYRHQFAIPFIAITGSCGKTTVKNMAANIFDQVAPTLATSGNFNNHIGLPLTLFKLNNQHKYAVIEMGASKQGDIEYLCKIAKPNITIINNVFPAHLEGFGTIENVSAAKAEIYSELDENSVAVVNIDESFASNWIDIIKKTKATIISYGLADTANIRGKNIKYNKEKVSFDLLVNGQERTVKLQVLGEHNVKNALAACAIAFAAKIPLETIVTGLETYQPVAGRLVSTKGIKGANIIDDSYNANPGSVKAAIEVLASYQGKKFLVLGDMGELGKDSIEYHKQIGSFAKQKGLDSFFAVGDLTKHSVESFGGGGKYFSSKQELLSELKDSLGEQTTVLIKGSRSQKMEVVAKALTEGV